MQGLPVHNTIELVPQELKVKKDESGVLGRFFQGIRYRRKKENLCRFKKIIFFKQPFFNFACLF